MKTRFNTHDIMCMVTELQRLVGMRVNQVYDIDNRTYVIRLQQSEEKCVLLLESGNRFHTTQFEWPKNVAPSGFTMKLRKHLKNKRLEKLSQIGVDRIVELQFGSGQAAYHVILELYDRGNIVLTDYEWTILNVLRPHVEGDKVRFAVKEKYPLDRAKTSYEAPSVEAIKDILSKARPNDTLKKVLNPHVEFGSAVIDHVLLENGLTGNMKIGKVFSMEEHLEQLVTALRQAQTILDSAKSNTDKGYITQKKVERPNPEGEGSTFLFSNEEFHPMLYRQLRDQPHVQYDSFDRAVDEFFSTLEGQKIDMKTVQIEREAMKKLQNVRKDHEKRVRELEGAQAHDRLAAELISRNEPLVEQARLAIQAAIANQMTWEDIKTLVKTAQENDDPIASCIKDLKLNTNHITLLLSDPYDLDDEFKPMLVDIDLSLTAFANARRYYDQKRNAAKKQQKTLESADKALKSAERKTKQTLKEAHTVSNIIKARKTYWFEKFYWFISSDNYLVIGGRDQQQNELLVRRYLRSTDVYVHADVAGAASIVVRNPTRGELPPRTVAEAGQAAVAYSVSWEARVVSGAWWVWGRQVSKSAPAGEYLTTGSFMIRGRKNYIITNQLSFGFGFMFRLEDSCIERHRSDRRVTSLEDDQSDDTSTQDAQEEEIVVSDGGEDSDKEENQYTDNKLNTIAEESPRKTGTDVQNETNQKETDKNTEKTNEDCKSKEKSNKESPKRADTDIQNQVDTKETNISNTSKVEDEAEKQDSVKETEEVSSESEGDSDSSDEFPDTHVKVDHGTGEVILQSKARTISEASDKSDDRLSFPSLPKKGGKKPKGKQEQKREERKEVPKRGQRGKMKRIKDKYKFQDEEDKEIALQIIQSAKAENEARKAAKKGDKKGGKSKQAQRAAKIPQPAPIILEAESDNEEPQDEMDGDGEECADGGVDADSELLLQLCGAPLPDDELLFAVPVVGPYATLLNYKYKVKLTPGTSKRGKAAKTAVQVFLRDKNATPREKDLLKAVKEENIARNFPGKVKLSAPALHKHKK